MQPQQPSPQNTPPNNPPEPTGVSSQYTDSYQQAPPSTYSAQGYVNPPQPEQPTQPYTQSSNYQAPNQWGSVPYTYQTHPNATGMNLRQVTAVVMGVILVFGFIIVMIGSLISGRNPADILNGGRSGYGTDSGGSSTEQLNTIQDVRQKMSQSKYFTLPLPEVGNCIPPPELFARDRVAWSRQIGDCYKTALDAAIAHTDRG